MASSARKATTIGRAVAATLAFAAVLAGAEAAAQTYDLVWSDEFGGSAVDSGNWKFETGGGGWGNNELEYYQPQNASVTNGVLTIQARRESVGANNYTSARMKTQGLHDWTYGKIEALIQGQNGQGYWPAFWMLGSNIDSVGWPGCGEIDIMEHIDSDNTAYGTIHWDNGGAQSYTGSKPTADFTAWHRYAIVWDTNGITWQVDGNDTGSANIQNNINGTEEFHKPFFILLNFAIGGNWPGNPDASTTFPANFNVDYVRVSQLGSSATPTPTAAPSGGGITTGATYTVTNRNSGKCVDAASAGTANGVVVQQYSCNGTNAQIWKFATADGGYYQIGSKNATGQVWDVTGGTSATGDGAKVELWAYGGATNQQWQPVSEAGGYYHFVARHSGKCLDVPGASAADAVQLQQYACNGTAAQSFSLKQVDAAGATATATATATKTPTATATSTSGATATKTATARATATATATAARATATATASGKCTGIAAFKSCTAYANGSKVVFNNTLYHAIADIAATRDCPPSSPYDPSSDNWWSNDGGC